MDHTDDGLDTGLDGHTELRVHGVSGTEPDELLGHPLLKRVAGDERSGFYRRWYPGGHSADRAAPRRLEAYRWGRLTSGPAARAAWLLLLPFMLANVAYWMLPAPRPGHRLTHVGARAAAVLLRLFALSLTMLLMLTAAQVAVDLAGWQCGRYPRCTASSSLLAPIRDGWLSRPGARVVAGAVVPALVVLGVGLLGRGHLRRRFPAATVPEADARHVHGSLTGRRFWTGDPAMRTLRAAHVAAAAAGLAAVVAWPATTLAATGVGTIVGASLCVTALGTLAGAAVIVARHDDRPGRSPAAAVQARRVALTLLGLAALFSMLDHGAWEPAGHLPGLRGGVNATVGTSMVLVFLLAVAVAVQRPWAPAEGGFRAGMRGLGAPAVCAVSFLVAAGFSAGLAYRVADVLGYPVIQQSTASTAIREVRTAMGNESLPFEDRQAAAEAQLPLVLPPSLAWAGAAATLIVVATVLVLAVVAVGAWRRLGPVSERVRRDHGVAPGEREHAVRRVALAIILASSTDGAGRVVGRITLAAAVIVTASLLVSSVSTRGGQLLEDEPLSSMTAFGTWLMGAFAIALIWLAWQTARNADLRRALGALWDIGSFWPRSAHPMAPPSYGERAVPELAGRLVTLTGAAPDSRVVLSGHSQGSILAAAAVLQVPAGCAERVGLITHGSPLRRLYARFFPAYFGPEACAALYRHLGGRWRNLYRATDPVGSWVLDPPGTERPRVDRELTDPRELDNPVRGHEEYWEDPVYDCVVAELSSDVNPRPTGDA